jgi:hypothetical protein
MTFTKKNVFVIAAAAHLCLLIASVLWWMVSGRPATGRETQLFLLVQAWIIMAYVWYRIAAKKRGEP